MKSRIEEEATAEIVRQVTPKLLERLHEEITKRTGISINRAAGLMEVSPETIKRLFASRIIHLGNRQQRITLADFDTVMDERRTGRSKAKKPDTGGEGSKV